MKKKMEVPQFLKTVVERLRDSGHQAYIVGGAVRDHCLRRKVMDWDVATSAGPGEIHSLFSGVKKFSLKHGTVTLLHSGRHYDVTPFRGQRGPARGIEGDLGHRDFTIDAMAYDSIKGIIVDPYGGREDIAHKRIRAVGKPEERFLEDPVRLLRGIRLATELGFRVEPKTLESIQGMAGLLGRAAPERIREELMKILLTRRPSAGLDLMRRCGLLEQVLPELLEGYRKRHDASHRYTIYRHAMETVDRVEPDPVLRLSALLHDIAKPRVRVKIEGDYSFPGHEQEGAKLGREIMRRLRFSKQVIRRVTNLIGHHMRTSEYHGGWTDGALRRLIRAVGPEEMGPLLSLRKADILAHGIKDNMMDRFVELEKRLRGVCTRALALKTEDLAIDGRAVMRILGLSAGPEVGRILEELLNEVTEDPERNGEEALMALLEAKKKAVQGPNQQAERRREQ